MRNRLVSLMVVAVAALALAHRMFAQTAAQSAAATAPPDLSGIWAGFDPARGPDWQDNGFNRRFSAQVSPLQPWAMELFKAHREGAPGPNSHGKDESDPTNNCFPAGFPRIMLLRQFQIIPLPDQVLMVYEYDHAVRRIYTDGRGHPDGFPLGWMGHSIGRWDGDTFVVDTVALTERTWVDRIGTPHSDDLHVVERYRRVDHNTLDVEFLFEDPKAFTKPWGGKKLYQLRPDMEFLEHTMCDEQLQFVNGKYRRIETLRKIDRSHSHSLK